MTNATLEVHFARRGIDPLREAFAARKAVLPWRNKRPLSSVEVAEVSAALHRTPSAWDSRLAYVHVPFCANHCLFCGFYQNAHTDKEAAGYVELLVQEFGQADHASQPGAQPIEALYLGGGTPSALSGKELEAILGAARKFLPLSSDCEITLEGRSIHFDDDKLSACLASGVNRVSIGVQSFNTEIRRRQGRKSSREQIIRFLQGLRARENTAMVIDLMYGLPDQTRDLWREDVLTAIALAPDGIDIYGLNLIPGTPLHKAVGMGKFPATAQLHELGEMYLIGAGLLLGAGWEQVSNSHWRRTSRERNRYNLRIKQGVDCLAFGAGAGGSAGSYSYANHRDLQSYGQAVGTGSKPISAIFMADALYRLRHEAAAGFEVGRLDLAALSCQLPEQVGRCLYTLARQWEAAGLLALDGDTLFLTPAGRFWYSNLIFAFDAVLSGSLTTTDTPSQTLEAPCRTSMHRPEASIMPTDTRNPPPGAPTTRGSIMNAPASLEALQTELAHDANGILETIAKRHQVPLQVVVDALPEQMRSKFPGSLFVEAMQDIAGWGKVTVVVHTPDIIMESHAEMPVGKLGHGFYNLQGGDGPLSGHLRPERCGAIYFVQRPFMGTDTCSVNFFNIEGEAMFKVYVGRDDMRRLKANQVERFNALARRLAQGLPA